MFTGLGKYMYTKQNEHELRCSVSFGAIAPVTAVIDLCLLELMVC